VPKVTLTCHPEPLFLLSQESTGAKDLATEKGILRFAQNDSFAVTLTLFSLYLCVFVVNICLVLHIMLCQLFRVKKKIQKFCIFFAVKT